MRYPYSSGIINKSGDKTIWLWLFVYIVSGQKQFKVEEMHMSMNKSKLIIASMVVLAVGLLSWYLNVEMFNMYIVKPQWDVFFSFCL